jgi:glucosamine 6-phosphate synthetase-like amidotransferase/phosphosugar isomerase protein
MCGIAGYSLPRGSQVERTLAAQSLLAAIAERGADAVGYAYRLPGSRYSTVVKQRTPASLLLDRISVPAEADQLLVHVRDYTKGHPSIEANNHPVRHGPVVGIHNGIITNDDELLGAHACARAEPQMTVDSEAIFAVAAHSRNDARALEELEGAMAAAWFDEREPDVLHLARGTGRPLWLGHGRDGVFFASTKLALEVLEHYCGVSVRKRQVREGTLLALRHGDLAAQARFTPSRYVEADPLPAVRAPGERESCLSRLELLLST